MYFTTHQHRMNMVFTDKTYSILLLLPQNPIKIAKTNNMNTYV